MGLTNMWSCMWLPQSRYEIFSSPARSSLEPLLYWTLHPPPVPGNHWCEVCLPGPALSRSYDAITECGAFCAWLLSHAHVPLICCFLWLGSAPHSSTLARKIPWTEEPGRLQSTGSPRVGQDWATSLWLFTFMRWRRKWQPTPVFLPGESQGQVSLVGCCLRGCTESDMTEAT